MKALTYTSKVVLAIVMIAGLSACGKKKNGSVAAAPVGAYCTPTANGMGVNALGQPCTPTANQCVFNGSTYTYPGTTTPCSPTSQCINGLNQYGQSCQGYPQYPNYPYPGQTQQYGCQQWTWQYGIQYVPVYLQGGLQCVRIDLLQGGMSQYPQQYYNSGYYNYGYDYYYAYPPYSGSGCSTSIDFGGSWGSIGICF